jgi:DNA (cytosine-5)-methyltransferase 1
MSAESQHMWVWWDIPTPAARNIRFADLVEDNPTGVEWRTAAETNYLLSLMSSLNRDKVAKAKKSGRRMGWWHLPSYASR